MSSAPGLTVTRYSLCPRSPAQLAVPGRRRCGTRDDGGVSTTYSNVDSSGDPDGAADCQDQVDAWPSVVAYKTRTYELLDTARLVLDLRSGPGNDLSAVGVDRTVGVDSSWVMCHRSHDRGGRVVVGDALALPFADGAFDGARADRVMQHLADPVKALDEMVRVTEPGGTVVVADPDQETLVIAVPGVRRELTDAVKRLRRDVGYRNGRLASECPHLFRGAGLMDVSVDAFPLLLRNPDEAFGLPKWVRLWRDEAGFTDDDEAEWSSGMDQARRDGLVYGVTFLVVAGRR